MESTSLINQRNYEAKFWKNYLCNPAHISHRIIILILTSFIAFGSFFCFDNPAALQSMFINDLHISYTDYMGLYSWYSWPNIVMSFFGGVLIDKLFGIRLATVLFGLLTVIGQILLAIGVSQNTLWLMYLSRLIFGIGAESLAVAQNTYAASWFKDKELNIVFGLQISVSRLGSSINTNTMAQLYYKLHENNDGKTSLSLSLLIASITCIISLSFCFILGYLDLRAFKMNRSTDLESEQNNVVAFKDIFKFNLSLWVLCIICFMFYSSILPFVSMAQALFVSKYQYSVEMANLANSIIYIISAVVSPFFGFGVDYLGHNLKWLTGGLVLLFIGHFLAAFTIDVSPFIITIILGLAYSQVASSLWGLVTFVVPKEKQGTAYGLMQAIMNLGVGSISLITGKLVDTHGYMVIELLYIFCSLIGILAIVYMYYWDSKNNNVLDCSQKSRLSKTFQVELS